MPLTSIVKCGSGRREREGIGRGGGGGIGRRKERIERGRNQPTMHTSYAYSRTLASTMHTIWIIATSLE